MERSSGKKGAEGSEGEFWVEGMRWEVKRGNEGQGGGMIEMVQGVE
jgi:hypothetical protein